MLSALGAQQSALFIQDWTEQYTQGPKHARREPRVQGTVTANQRLVAVLVFEVV
eukprot:m.286947 g.286947  ORF g.286947 m.286947 type:complete len:54 (-) comp15785_c0_seq1:866-1027(-)